jgi:hypothetical protein
MDQIGLEYCQINQMNVDKKLVKEQCITYILAILTILILC